MTTGWRRVRSSTHAPSRDLNGRQQSDRLDDDATIEADAATIETPWPRRRPSRRSSRYAEGRRERRSGSGPDAPSCATRRPQSHRGAAAITADDVPAMVERARAVQGRWEAIGTTERAKLFRRLRQWLNAHQDEFTDTISARGRQARRGRLLPRVDLRDVEPLLLAAGSPVDPRRQAQGRPQTVSSSATRPSSGTSRTASSASRPLELPVRQLHRRRDPGAARRQRGHPQAPSKTPLTSLLVQRGMREVGFPDDVFQVAVGPGPVGSAMVDHVDMNMFTGSTDVGKGVARQAAERLIPFSLETRRQGSAHRSVGCRCAEGGRPRPLLLARNGGQTCMSIERISRREPGVRRVRRAPARRLRPGRLR